ncbi:MAG: hypothetical protein ACLSHL_09285 [Alistipes communis]
MYYYDPDNKSPRRWAMIAAAVYCVLLAGSFVLVSPRRFAGGEKPGDTSLSTSPNRLFPSRRSRP